MKGSLFIVAAPSGAGKTSLVNALIKQDNGVALSVSHTTRAPRNGEVDGQDYHFVDRPTFDEMSEAGAFLESAIVFDNAYGTSAEAVEEQLNAGLDVILEIDWQGAQQVRETFADSVGVFILPPSKKTLEERLRGRGQDDEKIIQRRMRDAENEISHYDEFDYVIINDDFDIALASLSAIIVSKRHDLAKQQAQHAQLIEELLG
jgi:guanylate kinase